MESNQLLLEIEKNLRSQTESNPPITKLPPQLQALSEPELENALRTTIKALVQKRGMPFVPLSGSEMEAKIHAVISWLTGPQIRTSLILQGMTGTGKTTLMDAIYKIMVAANAPIASTSSISLHKAFALQTLSASWAFEEYCRMPRLCIDDLGAEPCRCMVYGVDYTPILDLITYRYAKQLPTIITTNLTDTMIYERYGDRITDRFAEMCTVLRFSGQSYRK